MPNVAEHAGVRIDIPFKDLTDKEKDFVLNGPEKKYKMDILIGDLIVELKSSKEIVPAHRAQLFNYMRLTKKPVGLLLNFGSKSLQGERYGYDELTNECHMLDRHMNIIPDVPDWYSTNDL